MSISNAVMNTIPHEYDGSKAWMCSWEVRGRIVLVYGESICNAVVNTIPSLPVKRTETKRACLCNQIDDRK
jgi:hypothetical protein